MKQNFRTFASTKSKGVSPSITSGNHLITQGQTFFTMSTWLRKYYFNFALDKSITDLKRAVNYALVLISHAVKALNVQVNNWNHQNNFSVNKVNDWSTVNNFLMDPNQVPLWPSYFQPGIKFKFKHCSGKI